MLSGKELMVGDYVIVANDSHPQVVAVVEEIFMDGEEMYMGFGNEVFDAIADEDISGVVLSKMFFLDNWFKEIEGKTAFTRLYNSDIDLEVVIKHGNYPTYKINGIEIKYVHEFQHLMRLLGFSTYANNLNVEI